MVRAGSVPILAPRTDLTQISVCASRRCDFFMLRVRAGCMGLDRLQLGVNWTMQPLTESAVEAGCRFRGTTKIP